MVVYDRYLFLGFMTFYGESCFGLGVGVGVGCRNLSDLGFGSLESL